MNRGERALDEIRPMRSGATRRLAWENRSRAPSRRALSRVLSRRFAGRHGILDRETAFRSGTGPNRPSRLGTPSATERRRGKSGRRATSGMPRASSALSGTGTRPTGRKARRISRRGASIMSNAERDRPRSRRLGRIGSICRRRIRLSRAGRRLRGPEGMRVPATDRPRRGPSRARETRPWGAGFGRTPPLSASFGMSRAGFSDGARPSRNEAVDDSASREAPGRGTSGREPYPPQPGPGTPSRSRHSASAPKGRPSGGAGSGASRAEPRPAGFPSVDRLETLLSGISRGGARRAGGFGASPAGAPRPRPGRSPVRRSPPWTARRPAS